MKNQFNDDCSMLNDTLKTSDFNSVISDDELINTVYIPSQSQPVCQISKSNNDDSTHSLDIDFDDQHIEVHFHEMTECEQLKLSEIIHSDEEDILKHFLNDEGVISFHNQENTSCSENNENMNQEHPFKPADAESAEIILPPNMEEPSLETPPDPIWFE